MPSVKIYSKEQTDTLLGNKADTSALPSSSQLVPSTSGATSGDVLTFDGTNVGWSAASGGSSDYAILTSTVNWSELVTVENSNTSYGKITILKDFVISAFVTSYPHIVEFKKGTTLLFGAQITNLLFNTINVESIAFDLGTNSIANIKYSNSSTSSQGNLSQVKNLSINGYNKYAIFVKN